MTTAKKQREDYLPFIPLKWLCFLMKKPIHLGINLSCLSDEGNEGGSERAKNGDKGNNPFETFKCASRFLFSTEVSIRQGSERSSKSIDWVLMIIRPMKLNWTRSFQLKTSSSLEFKRLQSEILKCSNLSRFPALAWTNEKVELKPIKLWAKKETVCSILQVPHFIKTFYYLERFKDDEISKESVVGTSLDSFCPHIAAPATREFINY